MTDLQEITFDQVRYDRWPDKIDQVRVYLGDGQWCWMTPAGIAQYAGVEVDQVTENLRAAVERVNRDLEGVHNYFDTSGVKTLGGRPVGGAWSGTAEDHTVG